MDSAERRIGSVDEECQSSRIWRLYHHAVGGYKGKPECGAALRLRHSSKFNHRAHLPHARGNQARRPGAVSLRRGPTHGVAHAGAAHRAYDQERQRLGAVNLALHYQPRLGWRHDGAGDVEVVKSGEDDCKEQSEVKSARHAPRHRFSNLHTKGPMSYKHHAIGEETRRVSQQAVQSEAVLAPTDH